MYEAPSIQPFYWTSDEMMQTEIAASSETENADNLIGVEDLLAGLL